jgi:hypothetical protein
MSKRIPDSKRDAGDAGAPGTYTLELVGLASAEDMPEIAMQVLDHKHTVLHAQRIGRDGSFGISADLLACAHRVVVGAPDDKEGILADAAITSRAREFMTQINKGRLALAQGIWSRFRLRWTCVSGSVRVCRRQPWWFDSVVATASPSLDRQRFAANADALDDLSPVSAMQAIAPPLSALLRWPHRCAPVCRGRVEVYRRACCCWPVVIDAGLMGDSRVHELIRDLERYVVRLPRSRRPGPGFPPPPAPSIGDPLQTPFFKDGALNELAINATADLQTLRSLPTDRAMEYIQSRAYLYDRLCNCSQATHAGSGTILPDGSFNIRWCEIWRLSSPDCHEQYAYVVKQTIGSTTKTIYNGLTAGAWFAAGEMPVLTSYDGNAFACNDTDSGGSGDAHIVPDQTTTPPRHALTMTLRNFAKTTDGVNLALQHVEETAAFALDIE